MRMANFIVPEAIIPDLKAATRDEAIREVVASLSAAGQLPAGDQDDVVKAILRREALGTTGIGHNIGIPHTRHAAATRLLGTMAVSKAGIPFESVDGEPVHVIVLLISPPDRPGDHLRALENVVNDMKDEAFVKALRAATSREEIWKTINGEGAGP